MKSFLFLTLITSRTESFQVSSFNNFFRQQHHQYYSSPSSPPRSQKLLFLDNDNDADAHPCTTQRPSLSLFASSLSPEDSAERAELLPLTSEDVSRLTELQSRQVTMPVMFLDAMVPGQTLQFQSADPKFITLIETVLKQQRQASNNNRNNNDDDDDDENNNSEMGMLGLEPVTRRPLCHGVTIPVHNGCIEYISAVDNSVDNDSRSKKNDASPSTMIRLTATADRRIEIQGEPWLDEETRAFYWAVVEMIDEREEILTQEQLHEAEQLSKALPDLIREWKQLVLQTGRTDAAGLERRAPRTAAAAAAAAGVAGGDSVMLPSELDLTGRAFYVAALINPLPPLGVALEIRPSMLACPNDYKRILLACRAIQGSIDHLSGKQKLF